MKPVHRDPGRDLASLDSLVLCGGLGTRLRPVLGDRPKCLAPVGGRSFLELVLGHLYAWGLRRFVLCVGHGADAVAAARPALARFGDVVLSREERRLGTGGALRLALAHVRSDPLLAVNGDSIASVDLSAMLAFYRERGARATVALAPLGGSAAARAAGAVELGADERIAGFWEKEDRRGARHLNAGVYLLAREVLRAIPAGVEVSLEREVLPKLVGKHLFGFPCDGGFYDIGTPERYVAAVKGLEAVSDAAARRVPAGGERGT